MESKEIVEKNEEIEKDNTWEEMQNQKREIESLKSKLRQSEQNRELLERTLRSSNEQHIRDAKIINQLQNSEFALLEKLKNVDKIHSSQEQSNKLANEYQQLQQRLQTTTESLESTQNENFQLKQTFEHEIEQVLASLSYFFHSFSFPSSSFSSLYLRPFFF